MILPSKELLSEVLGVTIYTEIKEDDINNNILCFWEFDGFHNECRNINIYELSHKMKEWACEQGYCIIQDTRGFTKVAKYGSDKRKFWEDENMDKAIERIFEACEWIL